MKRDYTIWFSINGHSTINEDQVFRKNEAVEVAQIVNNNLKIVYKKPQLPQINAKIIRFNVKAPYFCSVEWQDKEIALTVLGGFLFGDVISILEKPFADVEIISHIIGLNNGFCFSTMTGKTISIPKIKRFNKFFREFSFLDLEQALRGITVKFPTGQILETKDNALTIGRNFDLEAEIKEELDAGASFWEALREWLK